MRLTEGEKTRWMVMFPVRETVSEAHGVSESPSLSGGISSKSSDHEERRCERN